MAAITALEAFQTNLATQLDFVRDSFRAVSPLDALVLQRECLRGQTEAAISQALDFGALTQKMMTSAMGPFAAQARSAFPFGPPRSDKRV